MEQGSIDVVIKNELGLHARAAALFVKTASKYKADITVFKNGLSANGKSIMGVMMLAAPKGSVITIKSVGEDALLALEDLKNLVDNLFGEDR
ncbi:MAG: HPr family phosphocarrier protein [Deferribacterales bacterium]